MICLSRMARKKTALSLSAACPLCHPFLFQDGVLNGVLVDRVPLGVGDERDEFPEQALATQPHFFAEMPAAHIVIVHVGINAAYALPREEIVEKGICRLVCVAAALMRGIQDQAWGEGVRGCCRSCFL